MQLKMTLKDFSLIGMLGAAGGAGVVTTAFFHASIPLPGFGAVLFMPLATACLIIARARVAHPVAAGLTKVMQQLVIFFLPGGPPIAHNPVLLPLLVVDGFVLDGLFRLYPADLAKARLASGLLATLSGGVGLLVQVGVMAVFVGGNQFFLSQGVAYFLFVFLGFHSVLRFLGGVIGSWVLGALPERPA